MDKPYGGVNVVFSGDFYQLDPPGSDKQPLYEDSCCEFEDFINTFLELNGQHRFKDDPEWGDILTRFREGKMTSDDIRKINAIILSKKDNILPNLRYATYFNRDRDSINAALFEKAMQEKTKEETLRTGLLVFCDNIKAKDGSDQYVPFQRPDLLWNNLGEDDIKVPKHLGRRDPVLRLYTFCNLMLPCNKNVTAGQANGSQVTLRKVMLKAGETTNVTSLDGIDRQVQSVKASQIEYIEVKHVNERIVPSVFRLKPEEFYFTAKIVDPRYSDGRDPILKKMKMKCTQLPIIVTNAMTGTSVTNFSPKPKPNQIF